jgi:hypothetical protein
MSDLFKFKRATRAAWNFLNPVLAQGEPGAQIETDGQIRRLKIGDGVSAWQDLDFVGVEADYVPSYLVETVIVENTYEYAHSVLTKVLTFRALTVDTIRSCVVTCINLGLVEGDISFYDGAYKLFESALLPSAAQQFLINVNTLTSLHVRGTFKVLVKLETERKTLLNPQ